MDKRLISLIRGRDSKRAKIHKLLEDHIPSNLSSYIPHGWWYIGDVLIVSIPKQLLDFKHIIGEVFLHVEQGKARSVFGKVGPTKDIIRTPEFTYLAGDTNSETLHKELGCQFKIDAAKLTFSPGNHGERKRLIDILQKNEFIIDMFSCVGNLSLPLAVNNEPKKIIATEINPLAYRYLEENIKLNKVEDRIFAIFGDNRTVLSEYQGQAARVLFGYFNGDDQQKRLAIRLCKKGGIVHFHEIVPVKEEETDKLIKKLVVIIEQETKSDMDIAFKRVKKFSPGMDHIVFDVKIN